MKFGHISLDLERSNEEIGYHYKWRFRQFNFCILSDDGNQSKGQWSSISHASSVSNVHAFSTLYDGRNEKVETCEGLSSERPKNKQDKLLKDKTVIDKIKKGQNKKPKTVRGQKAYRTMWSSTKTREDNIEKDQTGKSQTTWGRSGKRPNQ